MQIAFREITTFYEGFIKGLIGIIVFFVYMGRVSVGVVVIS